MRRVALLLLVLLAGCASAPEKPSLVWADEAADIWLQAVRRNDPGAVLEMLTRASRAPYGSVEEFRSEGLPRVQALYEDFAWPGAAKREIHPVAEDLALAALWRPDGRAAAFPLRWEEGDWRVEWREGPPLDPERLPAGARVWVDGAPGTMQLQPGRHRVAVLIPEAGSAAAWTLEGRDPLKGGGISRPESTEGAPP